MSVHRAASPERDIQYKDMAENSQSDISIQSGECVARALSDAGFNVLTADIRPESLEILDDSSVDIFFPALHGEFGEDGRLQQILEKRSLVYAGSGPETSNAAFDKMAAKKAFVEAGVATPAAPLSPRSWPHSPKSTW